MSACIEYYRGSMSEDLICLDRNRDLDNHADTCNGDSGSFVGTSRAGYYEIDGVVSFGSSAGCEDNFSGHTEVIEYIDWIETNMAGATWE